MKRKGQSMIHTDLLLQRDQPEPEPPPLDTLTVKIMSLRLDDHDLRKYLIKVTFSDQLIINNVIKPIGHRDAAVKGVKTRGTMSYDPSDYEKMSLFAEQPLIVTIQPMQSETWTGNTSMLSISPKSEISCCNLDILPIFIDKEKLNFESRMPPLITPPILESKSWNNLPLVAVEVFVKRNPDNATHHKKLERANYMKLTLVGAYNLSIRYEEDLVYTAASKIPLPIDTHTNLVTYCQGYLKPKNFNNSNFYPQWENLRIAENTFPESNMKLNFNMSSVQNYDEIDLNYHFNEPNTIIWGSFHRTLMINQDQWMWKQLRNYFWPMEVHVYGEMQGASYMAFLDFFKLLYAGENTIVLASPLHWADTEIMMEKCGCDYLLTPNSKPPSTAGTQKISKSSKAQTDSYSTGTAGSGGRSLAPTGADGSPAFVIVQVQLRRPLKKISLPPTITDTEIQDMLLESEVHKKRICKGRGQGDLDWVTTVQTADNALRKLPMYGTTDFCSLNRQLSETRTRVEIEASFSHNAAIFVNNNFIPKEFLRTEETYEEMLLMAHVCLTKMAAETIIAPVKPETDPIHRAARHAHQLQDIPHAIELYLSLAVYRPRDQHIWRELSTCLQDVDKDWAKVCIDRSFALDPRCPLTLLSVGALMAETSLPDAEPFFMAILCLFPFWETGWMITAAYFYECELYNLADFIVKTIQDWCSKSIAGGQLFDIGQPRSWERELGDWWDNTPMMHGLSRYYDAADLLLRLRALKLAETCLALAVTEGGECAAYYHMIALSHRLRGNVKEALCFLKTGLNKYGEVSYLRTLEAECYHNVQNHEEAYKSFQKAAGGYFGPFSTLLSLPSQAPQEIRPKLVDLLRCQPSAYAWMALADDYIIRSEKPPGETLEQQSNPLTMASACAVQALKWDREAGRAWALLAKLTRPHARRQHCANMAHTFGYSWCDIPNVDKTDSRTSTCYRLGWALRECRCNMCDPLHL